MTNQTAIRYVITPDNLAFITLLNTGRKLVVQAPFFRNLLSLQPRSVLGSTTIDNVQLRMLGVIPAQKEVHIDDTRITIGA